MNRSLPHQSSFKKKQHTRPCPQDNLMEAFGWLMFSDNFSLCGVDGKLTGTTSKFP